MICKKRFAAVLLAVAVPASLAAQPRERVRHDANGNLDALIAKHAAANNLPESLVRRVIARESRGNPRVVSHGNYGLMQIKLATARAMGYRGSAAGLLDADTNMTYAVKYLAGAYRVAGGNADRAVHYYARGYYYAAKRKGLAKLAAGNETLAFASAPNAVSNHGVGARQDVSAMKAKLAKARESTGGVSSASNPYTGKLDYY
ncbi:MAG: lytic transglycosylase domain-containing protein [Pseudolabrys sp.]|nr:lytic transglycosylase domain-containing protein [Pseudolabrys sp.]